MEARLHQTGRTEAWEAYDVVGGAAPLVLSCEHASAALPDGYGWSPADAWLVETHWSHDLGAAGLTRDLATALGCPAVLAGFSRLLCDPNRDLDSPTLFRERADGHPIHLNRGLDDRERRARIDRFYRPYHERLDATVAERSGAVVLAVHTFTPVFEGQRRHLDVGVLFDRDDRTASALTRALAEAGLEARPNEPYSGRRGMMFSAQHHADRHGREALEVEVRQDLVQDARWRRRLVRLVREALEASLR